MSIRSSSYSVDEDVLLCQVYMDISQDPITGVNQSSTQFWSRVEDTYNSARTECWEYRNKRSVQSRIQTIEKAVRKLNSCIRQVENMHPSGASDKDIINRAKILLMQDDSYKKGFKFDHVWNMVKNFEKFKDNVSTSRKINRKQNLNYISSESDNPTPESPISASPGLSSFSLNLDDDIGGSSSERPIGVKNAKLKRKNEEQISSVINSFKEENRQLLEMLKKNSSDRQQHLEIQSKNLALKELKEENKILMRDLNTISDPRIRAYIEAEQIRILDKRSQQHQTQPPSASNEFGDYFNHIGGSGTGLPNY